MKAFQALIKGWSICMVVVADVVFRSDVNSANTVERTSVVPMFTNFRTFSI